MRDILEHLFFPVSILMLVFGLFFGGIGLIISYQQAQYIKSHYNIEVSTKDLFWNEKLVMSELRSKGIITDNNENNNITINKGE
jgi:hypothetical protein